jgi:hypothetical protein
VSKRDNNEYHVDLSFTGQGRDYSRPIGFAVAAAGIIFIIATMTTSLAARILPMNDSYLGAMIPVAPDGGEPLGLTSLMHDITEKTISVSGSVMNRSDEPMSNIVAVFDMQDTTGRFPQTVTAPVAPAELPPHGAGNFMAMATLQEKPGGYTVKFRFADGPFIPHKDDRGPALSITPQLIPAPPK